MASTNSAGSHTHTYTPTPGPAGPAGPQGVPGPAGAPDTTLAARLTMLEARVSALEAPPVVVPVVPPPAQGRPWALPATTRTVVVPNLGAGDVTSALNAFLASVPDGSIVDLGSATYRISGGINLAGHNHLLIKGSPRAMIISAASGTIPGSFFYQANTDPTSSHITIRGIDARGGNTTPGHMSGAGEFAAFLHTLGGSYYEIDDCTATGLHGDFYTMNAASRYAWVHGSSAPDCGRNFVSVVWGSHLLVERNVFGWAGWSVFDVEAEVASNGQTFTDLAFRDNIASGWNAPHGFFFGGCNAATATAILDGVEVRRNTVTGKSLLTLIDSTNNSRRRNVVVSDNVGKVAVTPIFGRPAVLNFGHVDNVVCQGNVQPISGAYKIADFHDCTGVVTT